MIETKPDIKSLLQTENLAWETINQATQEIHKAVQWIGRVENASLLKKYSDRTTKLHWHSRGKYFYGDIINEQAIRIGFKPEGFQWLLLEGGGVIIDTLSGLGKSDEVVRDWLQENLIQQSVSKTKLQYELPYSLPYAHDISSIYSVPDNQSLTTFSRLRSLGIRITKAALLYARPRTLKEEIFTWLHDFESCVNIPLYNTDEHRSIGVGMATGNSMISEHYLYVRNWAKNAVFNSRILPSLPSDGYWLSKDGWNGAVLPFSKLMQDHSLQLELGVLFIIGAIETLVDY